MKYNILIADDVSMNRLLIRNIIKSKLDDINFFEAQDGNEVLAILKTAYMDLIILDLIMPNKDGFETLAELKSNLKYQHIPVIVSSAISEVSSIEKTLEMGAVEYFTKPFSSDEIKIILPLKVKNALKLHDQNNEIERLNVELNQELKNANEFAKLMLPAISDFNKVQCEIKYYPSLGIGGDFIDCVEMDGKVWFMIADITGHGIAAGMASSMIKVLFRMTLEADQMTPKKLLESINSRIFNMFGYDKTKNYIVFTSFVGCIENSNLTYANAGQPYPIIYRSKTDDIISIEKGGMLVGIIDGTTYDDHVLRLTKDDSIFLYTDGLFSTGKGSDCSNWNLVKESARELKEFMSKDSKKFLENIFWKFSALHKARGTEFNDDVALMHITVR